MDCHNAKISEIIADMHVIDTHEHTYPREIIVDRNPSIIDVLEGSYVFWVAKPPARRNDFASLVRSIKKIYGSAYYKAASIAIKEIYGVNIDPPNEGAFMEASKLICEAYNDKNWIRKLFREMSLIDKVLWDPYWDVWGESFDPDLFKSVFRINCLLFGYSRKARDHNGNSPYIFEQYLNMKVESFEDYMNLVDKTLEEAKKRGYVALKSALAYDRTLIFKEVEEEDAKKIFNKKNRETEEIKLFQDYVLHHILERARELDFPIQFHTGLARIERVKSNEPSEPHKQI